MPYEVADDIAASTAVQRRIKPTYGYYRQPNGWITISTITRLEALRYTESGWTHLAKYGAFDMTPYVANHPFEGLLMFGGVGELSVEQILQTGLHLNPPRVPRCGQHMTQFHRSHTAACWAGAQVAVFPQLDTVPDALKQPFLCGFCQRKDIATKEALKQHQSVAHSEELGRLQTGESMGTSLAKVLGQTASNGAKAETPDVAGLQAQLAAMETKIRRLSKRKRKATRSPDNTELAQT